MGEMQKKVIAAIKEASQEAGLDCVVNYSYANTGNMVFQKGFDTVLSCAFDFQTAYASLQFYPPGVRPTMCIGFTHEKCVHDVYFRYDSMADGVRKMLDFIRSKGQVAA